MISQKVWLLFLSLALYVCVFEAGFHHVVQSGFELYVIQASLT